MLATEALGLDETDAPGWDAMAAYAVETTVMADDQRTGVFRAPAQPDYDERAADALANATQTEATNWSFPLRDGIEARSAAKQDAPWSTSSASISCACSPTIRRPMRCLPPFSRC
jgi:hypothetical protein